MYLMPAKTLLVSDVRRCMSASNQPNMSSAETMIGVAEKMCVQYGLTEPERMEAIGFLSVRIILAILNKKHKDLPRVESMEHAGLQFVEEARPCHFITLDPTSHRFKSS